MPQYFPNFSEPEEPWHHKFGKCCKDLGYEKSKGKRMVFYLEMYTKAISRNVSELDYFFTIAILRVASTLKRSEKRGLDRGFYIFKCIFIPTVPIMFSDLRYFFNEMRVCNIMDCNDPTTYPGLIYDIRHLHI